MVQQTNKDNHISKTINLLIIMENLTYEDPKHPGHVYYKSQKAFALELGVMSFPADPKKINGPVSYWVYEKGWHGVPELTNGGNNGEFSNGEFIGNAFSIKQLAALIHGIFKEQGRRFNISFLPSGSVFFVGEDSNGAIVIQKILNGNIADELYHLYLQIKANRDTEYNHD